MIARRSINQDLDFSQTHFQYEKVTNKGRYEVAS